MTTTPHTVRLKEDVLRPAMKRAGIELMSTLVREMGMNRSAVDRVVMRGEKPGARFIGSLLVALPDETFDSLFEVVRDSEAASVQDAA